MKKERNKRPSAAETSLEKKLFLIAAARRNKERIPWLVIICLTSNLHLLSLILWFIGILSIIS